jgi:endonuclease YncB( thermonuclease family)
MGVRRPLLTRHAALLALAFAVGASVAPAARADTDLADSVLVGTVTRVIDGDSLRVRLAGAPAGSRGEIEVRLHGADAPEYRQAGGREAKSYLRRQVAGRRVTLAVVTTDRYDRLVAVVGSDGAEPVNAGLVAAGHAWANRRYLGEVPGADRLCALEAEARAARRGLWARPPDSWVPPWLFRRTTGPDGADLRVRSYAAETEADCRRAIPRPRRPAAAPTATQPEPQPVMGPDGGDGDCRIKGNISDRGDRIYHVPGSRHYDRTRIDTARGERWFCSAADARAAGFRAPR